MSGANDPGAALAGRFPLAVAAGLSAAPSLAFALGQLWLLGGQRFDAGSAAGILIVALAASLALAWAAGGRRPRPWDAPAFVAGIIIAATVASGLIYDTSYDGQGYHFQAVQALAEGWNPFRDGRPRLAIERLVGPAELWAQFYPKGLWTSSALQVAAGLPPEAAKNQPLIFMAAVVFAVFGAGVSLGFGRSKSVVVAVVTAGNPVVLVQLFSRMNDGVMGSCFVLVTVFTALWLLKRDRWALAAAALTMVTALNLKFSAVPVFALLSALICFFALFVRGWRGALRTGSPLLGAGLAGLMVFGAHPYVTNTIDHHQPFYPLMGEGKVDIMTGNRPVALNAMSPPARLAASLFAATSNDRRASTQPKLPFTAKSYEGAAVGLYDARLAGFGPWFSGALLLSLAAAAGAALQRNRPPVVTGLLAAAGGCLAIVLAMPENWWARYVPQLWFAVALVTAAALASCSERLRLLGWTTAAVLLFDAVTAGGFSLAFGLAGTRDIRAQLSSLAAERRPVCAFVGTSHARAAMIHAQLPSVQLQPRPLASCAVQDLAGTFTTQLTAGQVCVCPG